MDYISVREVLDNLLDDDMMQGLSLERAVKWTVDFMRKINVPNMYEERHEAIEFHHHIADLPCDCVQVIGIESIDKCHKHVAYIASKSNFEPTGLSYKVQGNKVIGSLPHDHARISYWAIKTDEDGYPMIPDNGKVEPAAAARNGLYADFSPKPLSGQCGNGFHINISVKSEEGKDVFESFMAGVLSHIKEMTVFLNPIAESYDRLGSGKAPSTIGWAKENRTQLIRIPSTRDNEKRFEVRSPDPTANPYIAFALLIYAGLDGIKGNFKLPEPANPDIKRESLPKFWGEAADLARQSEFIRNILNNDVESFLRR